MAAGRILLRGAPIQGLPPHEIAARGVRRTFQNGGLFGHLTALENVLVGLHTEIGSGLLGAVLGSRACAPGGIRRHRRGPRAARR